MKKKKKQNLNWIIRKFNFTNKNTLIIIQLSCIMIPSITFSQSDNTYGSGHIGGDTDGNRGRHNINIGHFAGKSSISVARFNVSIGSFAGRNNQETYNTFIGYQAGMENTIGPDNTFIGSKSGRSNTLGSFNVFLGKESGRFNIIGNNNVFIGHKSGYNASGNGNIFIGNDSGANETGSNKLYIDNSNTVNPLIWGDFTENRLSVNGDLDVTGKFTINGNEINTNSASSLWTSLSNQNIAYTAGNVGIANNNPNHKLDVNGTVHTEGNLILSGTNNYGIFSTPTNGRGNIVIPGPTSQYLIGVQDGNGRVQHKWNATAGTGEKFLVSGENAFFMNWNGGVGGNRWLDFKFANGSGKSAGDTIDWQSHFSIENNGYVGIGMTSAPTEKLQVNGNIKTSKVFATSIEVNSDSQFKQDVYVDGIISADEAIYTPIGNFTNSIVTKKIEAESAIINNSLTVSDVTVNSSLNANEIDINILHANSGEITNAFTVGSLTSSDDITTSKNLNCQGLTIQNKSLKSYIVNLIEDETEGSNGGGGLLGGAITGALTGAITGAATGAVASYVANKAKFAGDVISALGDVANAATDVADNLQKKAKNNKVVTPWKKSVRTGEIEDGFTGIKYTRGYVMIGNTANDDKERLLVNGRTNINGNLVAKRIAIFNNPEDFNRGNNPAWPDYVFEKNYDLKPLTEVELFINSNKHLPEVPSAKEVSESGIDVYNMNATLLKKVEELTLYTIDQEKQIKEQKELLKKQEDRLKKLETIVLNKTK